MLAILLATGSSLVYGVSDFLGGLKSRSLPLLSVLLVSQGSALVLLVAVVIASGESPPEGQYILYGAIAGLAEAVGVAALYRGLAVGTMSIVAPIASTAPVVPIVAAIALGELPGAIQAVGILLAVAGVALISYSGAERSASGDVTPSVLFGLLTALGFGGFLVAMDAASEGSVPWALFMARVTSVAAFVAVFLIRRPRLAVRPAELPVLALIGALIIAADALYAVATTEGLLSVVAVLSSLYPIVTIALARAYLDERIERLQQVGVAVALVGVAAISALE
jgi:drug/metabolite transporter (DMT)-like permease